MHSSALQKKNCTYFPLICSASIGSSPALSDAAAGGRRVAAGGSGRWVTGCGTLNSVGCGGQRQRPTQPSRRAAAEAVGGSVARAGEGGDRGCGGRRGVAVTEDFVLEIYVLILCCKFGDDF